MEKFSGKSWGDISNATTLLSPIKIGDLQLKNRVVMGPMTRSRAVGEKRLPNDLMAEYYVQRASAGLIISEAIVVSKQAISRDNTPGLYTDLQAEAWKVLLDKFHAAGGRMFAQLWHAGRASHNLFQPGGRAPVSPSAIRLTAKYIHTPEGKKPYVMPRALETQEISGIVEDYRNAAKRAKEARFDGIELHGAAGFLIDQFLQSATNKRTDQYSGSLENRFRFVEELMNAVCNVYAPNRVAIRLSPNSNYNDMGSLDVRETFFYAMKRLNEYGLAFVEILDGLVLGFHEFEPLIKIEEFREVFDGRLIGNAGYTRDLAEIALLQKKLDLVSFGRPWLSNPDLVERFRNDWPLEAPPHRGLWYTSDSVGYTNYPVFDTDGTAVKYENFN